MGSKFLAAFSRVQTPLALVLVVSVAVDAVYGLGLTAFVPVIVAAAGALGLPRPSEFANDLTDALRRALAERDDAVTEVDKLRSERVTKPIDVSSSAG